MKILKNVVNVIAVIALLLIIFACIVVLIDSIKNPYKVPSFFGWKPFIVVENEIDEIKNGDIAIVKECDISELKNDDLIAYKDSNNIVTICKIKSVGENEIIVKIDNSENELSISKEQIEGKFQYRIAFLGWIALEIQRPMVTATCVALPLIIVLITIIVDYEKEKELMKLTNEHQENMREEIEKLKKQNEELKQKN